MTEQEAKQIIYNALNVATLKGCYNLNEMTTIIEASKIVLLSGENTIS